MATNAIIEKVYLGRDANVIMWRVIWDTHRSHSGLGSSKCFKTLAAAKAFAATLQDSTN
jgi:hypothetical protein